MKTAARMGPDLLEMARVALVRAVNVGGTGRLPMTELAAACREIGWTEVKTYLASGNVVFRGTGTEKEMVARLEAKLGCAMGKPVTVLLRTARELEDALRRNPFGESESARTLIFFLPLAAPPDAARTATGRKREEIASSGREVFVHYPDGIADSRLKIPAVRAGTARNLNTVRKLEEMARTLDSRSRSE
jgi:uncharacterized protein (DUF1697 family)